MILIPSAGGGLNIDTGASAIVYPIFSSMTWTAPADGYVTFTAIGGGGSGGATIGNVANELAKATGGGAGALAIRRYQVKTSDVFTLTVGTGGAAVTATNGNVQGNPGAATTIVRAGVVTVTAGGGGGGLAADPIQTLAGGVGGTATNGEVNLTGGAGGAILNVQATGGILYAMATGGGAVNIFGFANRGGNINNAALPGAQAGFATGGANINQDGNGVDISSFPGTIFTNGGNSGFIPAASGGPIVGGVEIATILGSQNYTAGGAFNISGARTAASNYFGGGGGQAYEFPGNYSRTGLNSAAPALYFGGGGGGCAANANRGVGNNIQSGAGANGLILARWTRG